MWNLKKRHDEFLCRTHTDSQTLKNLWFPKETDWGVGDELGVWDGNAIKSGQDDHCTTINVVKFIDLKKKKKEEDPHMEKQKEKNPKLRLKF